MMMIMVVMMKMWGWGEGWGGVRDEWVINTLKHGCL